jgi:hypothetical protein
MPLPCGLLGQASPVLTQNSSPNMTSTGSQATSSVSIVERLFLTTMPIVFGDRSGFPDIGDKKHAHRPYPICWDNQGLAGLKATVVSTFMVTTDLKHDRLEGFFGTLKQEQYIPVISCLVLPPALRFLQLLNVWYNRARRHSSLGYISAERTVRKNRDRPIRK